MLQALISLVSQLELAGTDAKLGGPLPELQVQIIQVGLLLLKAFLSVLVNTPNDYSLFGKVVLIRKSINHLFAKSCVESIQLRVILQKRREGRVHLRNLLLQVLIVALGLEEITVFNFGSVVTGWLDVGWSFVGRIYGVFWLFFFGFLFWLLAFLCLIFWLIRDSCLLFYYTQS